MNDQDETRMYAIEGRHGTGEVTVSLWHDKHNSVGGALVMTVEIWRPFQRFYSRSYSSGFGEKYTDEQVVDKFNRATANYSGC